MGKSSQKKGAAGERELVGILQQRGYHVERGGSETFGTIPDVTGLPGIHIECKRVERLNVPEAMKQAIRDAERFRDGAPTVFHRRNREPWLVTMLLSDWLKVYEQGYQFDKLEEQISNNDFNQLEAEPQEMARNEVRTKQIRYINVSKNTHRKSHFKT